MSDMVPQAGTLRTQLIQAQAEAEDAKSTADASIAELQASLKDAVDRQQEPAVRLSNPQARALVNKQRCSNVVTRYRLFVSIHMPCAVTLAPGLLAGG